MGDFDLGQWGTPRGEVARKLGPGRTGVTAVRGSKLKVQTRARFGRDAALWAKSIGSARSALDKKELGAGFGSLTSASELLGQLLGFRRGVEVSGLRPSLRLEAKGLDQLPHVLDLASDEPAHLLRRAARDNIAVFGQLRDQLWSMGRPHEFPI
jgi:hypothetical protein